MPDKSNKPKNIGHPKLDEAHLPFYQEWKADKHPSVGLWDYLRNNTNYDMLAAVSKLFWPDFVEIDGCIFTAEGIKALEPRPGTKAFKKWVNENPRQVEWLANHLDIPYILADNGVRVVSAQNEEGELHAYFENTFPHELFEYLARVILVCWKHALAHAFPDKVFELYYDADHPTISFYQKVEDEAST